MAYNREDLEVEVGRIPGNMNSLALEPLQTLEMIRYKRNEGFDPLFLTIRLGKIKIANWLIHQYRFRGLPLWQLFADTLPIPLERNVDTSTALRTLLTVATQRRLMGVYISGAAGFTQRKEMDALGFNTEESHTLILKIDRPIEDLWEGLEKRCRNAIRRASKSGVTVQEVSDTEDFYELLRATYIRTNELRFCPSRESIRNLSRYGSTSGICRVLLASRLGRPLAGAIVVAFKEKAYYAYGASVGEGQAGASNLLLWETILRMREKQVRLFDFGGVNYGSVRLARVSKFKESFSGTKATYYSGYKGYGIGRVMNLVDAAQKVIMTLPSKL